MEQGQSRPGHHSVLQDSWDYGRRVRRHGQPPEKTLWVDCWQLMRCWSCRRRSSCCACSAGLQVGPWFKRSCKRVKCQFISRASVKGDKVGVLDTKQPQWCLGVNGCRPSKTRRRSATKRMVFSCCRRRCTHPARRLLAADR